MIVRCLAMLAALLIVAGCDQTERRWLQGYAEGEYVRLGAPAAGWIENVAVQRGDVVTVGAPLFTLEAERQRAAVRQAEAELARATAQLADLRQGKRPEEIAEIAARLAEMKAAKGYADQDLARQERLARTDVAAVARLDQARSVAMEMQARLDAMAAQLATARLPARDDQIAAAAAEVTMQHAALVQAQWQLDQRTVRAPMAALVEDRVRQSGEWVDAGGIVVSLLPPEKVKVRFFVPEPMLGGLAVGQRVRLRCDGCADSMSATIRYIAREAEFTPPVIYSVGNREKLVFMVEAWPDERAVLHPGQPVDVDPAPG